MLGAMLASKGAVPGKGVRQPQIRALETRPMHWWVSVGGCDPEQWEAAVDGSAFSRSALARLPAKITPERRAARIRHVRTTTSIERRAIVVNGRNVTVQHHRAPFAI